MRAEIILPCRGELPGNLRRTVMLIARTIGPDDKLTVLLDGPHPLVDYRLPFGFIHQPFDHARGPGQCRHWGIVHSEAKYVVLVDGHMTFPTGWLDMICRHLANPAHAKDVTCCHTEELDSHWRPVRSSNPFAGAHLELKSPKKSRKNWWLNAIWNLEPLAEGIVGAPLGACYGMRRSWYTKMGEPLGILEAWGGEEELLSACSWLMGGRVYLLPVKCGHIFNAPNARPDMSVAEKHEMWANQYAMLDALPVRVKEHDEMHAYLDRANNRQERVDECKARRVKDIIKLALTLQGGKRTWDDLKTEGIIRPWKTA